MRSFTTPPTHSNGSPWNVFANILRCGSSCSMPPPKPRDGEEQRAVLAARQRAARVGLVEQHGREARGRVDLHHVARVVVREQDRAVVAGDRAVGVVAFPRPHDLPALPRGDHAGDRGRSRQRGSGRWRRIRRGRCAAADRGRLRRRLALGRHGRVSGVLPSLLAVPAIELGRRFLRDRVGSCAAQENSGGEREFHRDTPQGFRVFRYARECSVVSGTPLGCPRYPSSDSRQPM